MRLFDQTRDPGAQSGGVAAEKLSVVACLDAMNAWNKPAQPEFLSRRQSKRIDVARNTTHAARDCEQLCVKIRVPIPTEPELKKGLVESLPMKLLGIDKGAIHVEEQGFQLHKQLPCIDQAGWTSPMLKTRLERISSASIVDSSSRDSR